MSKNKHIEINVPILARVEGEGALDITIRDQKIESLHLKIYEPPRLFEKFLEGRSYSDVLDIVARICGICPVAYQMSAVHAIEQCFELTESPWVRKMRRVFYCGEWLESHSLHVHLLAAPDFLGFKSAADMARVYPEQVRLGMRLQAYGNNLVKLFGGRSVHPVGACVGGFYSAPTESKVQALLQEGRQRIADCETLIAWLSSLTIPNHAHDFTWVSLYHPSEYPMNEGEIISNRGLKIPKEAFDAYFKEHQVPYSTALHCLLQDENYLVGPLARVNNCFEHLPNKVHVLLDQLGIVFPSRNMFDSIIARAVEMYYCVLESIRLLENYIIPSSSFGTFHTKAGVGVGCTEAPRGMLWHRYEFDDDGIVKSARIVPPTSQNQARIEADLRNALEQFGLDHDQEALRLHSEMVVRNYDPCISCSTHFLKLSID